MPLTAANTPAEPAHKHKNISLHDPEDQANQLDLLEYWRSITKRKWAILGFGFLVALLAGVVVFALTPVYRATTTVLIEANKNKVVSIEDVYSGLSQNREYFQTQVEIIKSREVSIRAIESVKLWDYPEFDPRLKEKGKLQELQEKLGISEAVEPKEWTNAALADAVYGKFSKQLNIEPVRLSQLAKISFESTSPALSALVANTVANTYIENDLDARYKMTKQASGWLQERLSSLKSKLDDSERGLQNYREKAGIVDVKGSSQSGAGKQIEEVTQRLVETRLRRAEAENAYNQIKSVGKNGDFSSLPAVVRNSNVSDALKSQADAERNMSEVSQRYGFEHPKYVAAEAQLKSARENVKRQVDAVVGSVTREYEVAVGTERALEGTLNSARGSIQNLNRKEFELGVLEREADSNRQIYDMFMKRAKETNVSGDLQSAVARVVDAAVVPTKAVKPQKPQIIGIAFVLGLFIGVLVSLLLDRLDNTIKTTDDVEAKLKAPLLTTLPLLDKGDTDRASSARLFIDNPKSIYSEAVRTARTGVLLSAIDVPNRILLVTSSLPGEGKTTFSINLALAHAQTKRTLLIDADMRRPAVTKGLDLAPSAKGLSNLVAGTAELDDCLQAVEGSSLSVLGSGPIPPNPLELMLSQKFKSTLDHLATIFDVIVIDSPPVELVSDALVISAHATGVIYVVKAADTPYPLARKGLQRIRRADGDIMGVVLNRFDFAKAERYYGEYSGYGKYGYGKGAYAGGYGEVYGSEPEGQTKAQKKKA
ncbi:polysaccharide biosynthesis tyrosine autokinase [Curvibacter sp. RS43]|uniref:GumC family protein n=1 Tax=Curvibacter microcysteis TaxID=3026419 RepID=UPI0023604A74|nr:polysaccharide biosynthesis tyrosine autokinase [Curvibacter sp. RS43]MDD0809483.1 polysaccharide biosynthesis tyrosine autokinase [Curvibacter sp. RS43]